MNTFRHGLTDTSTKIKTLMFIAQCRHSAADIAHTYDQVNAVFFYSRNAGFVTTKKQVFSLSRKIFPRSKYPKNVLLNFENRSTDAEWL